MTTCPKFRSQQFGYPVNCIGFTQSNQLLACGGGGASNSGVKNKLVSCKINARSKELEIEAEMVFASGEDAPTCLAVHPKDAAVLTSVNATEDMIKKGENKNCRLFEVGEANFQQVHQTDTVRGKSHDDWQSVIRFNLEGNLVATGTTNGYVHLLKYPSLEPEIDWAFRFRTKSEGKEHNDVEYVDFSKKESAPAGMKYESIDDLDFNLEDPKLVVVLRHSLEVIYLQGRNKGKVTKSIPLSLLRKDTFGKDQLGKDKYELRFFRYGRGRSKDMAFVVANSVGKGSSYLIVVNAHTFEFIKKYTLRKAITTFCLSQDGELIAFSCRGDSTKLLSASTLQLLTSVNNGDDIITSIAISPDRRLLVTSSAGSYCDVVSLPLSFPTDVPISPLKTLLAAVLLAGIILAVTTKYTMGPLIVWPETPALVTQETPQPVLSVIENTETASKDEL